VLGSIASDIGALIDLSRRTISASYRSILGDEVVDVFLGSGASDRYVQENLDRCSVIVRDGQVAGYAVCRDNLVVAALLPSAPAVTIEVAPQGRYHASSSRNTDGRLDSWSTYEI
jgi:hypothetical protein